MSALLIRRKRPIGEPDVSAGAPGAETGHPHPIQVIDGTAGAGRISAALLELGIRLDGLRQAVIDPAASNAELDASDLGSRFDLVVLGSHLINQPEPERRSAFLGLAVRHLGAAGRLLIEHHPTDWAETAEDMEATPGSSLGMVNVRRDPPFVSAVSVYDAFGRVVRQPFTARVLSDAELATELERSGLTVSKRLGPTWLEATPSVVDAPLHRGRATSSLG